MAAALLLLYPLAPVRAEPPAKGGAAKQKGPRGTLVIVGGGLMPDTVRDRFLELGGGPKARLVVIPTASRRVDAGIEKVASYSYWMPLEKESKVSSVSFLHTRNREEADDPKFVKPLLDASAVWFPGGDQILLTDAYKGTAVERAVRAVLDRGGVVGGTSAGAAVMSEIMIRSGNPVAEVGAGFGFVGSNLILDQHFHERNRLPRLLGVLAKHPKHVGLGIDERTAIEVRGQKVTVLGQRNVRLCLPDPNPEKAQVKVLAAGSEIDLDEYCPILTADTKAPPAAETKNTAAGVKMD
jgi:cyanophycinase